MQGRVKEPFLYKGLRLATLQESGSLSMVIDRLHKSLIGLDKDFAPSFRECPDKLLRPVDFETLGSYAHNI